MTSAKEHPKSKESRMKRINWLLSHRSLWKGDEFKRLGEIELRQFHQHLIGEMKKDGIVAPTTYAFDVRLHKLLAEALTLEKERQQAVSHGKAE